ncbi:ABC transporter ATP-binding protein [Congregibacter litoralis]|uniref:Carbohydrate ABC transporter ATP-binding protein, CUT1 family n=1 Tax=Congregibacter litoralis KT71 TaxID=314285 RepID=A4ADB5_9GAMM|nr:ABC transporter ATP-binding protein [Congregibacter litoralis]EAQ96039.1 carbohydrate ABC transporter ATP-binding protein, CUT1 family [Congregibacter litoralis KT71]
MLSLSDISLTAETTTSFSHSFAAGEISVVLGANQSGKTDLCRLIAGLNTRARGKISLDGQSLDSLSPRQRPVGMVYQAFVNYPNLTVFENIASPLRAQKTDAATMQATVGSLAEKLQISALLQRYPHELSGGQQQRVAIARAMAKGALVLLLDEPLVNLDFKLRESLELELRDLLRASQTTVIYTSSDPRDAFTLGDQLLLLHKGQKLQCGTPLSVYENPESAEAMALMADPDINRFYRDDTLCALRPEHLSLSAAPGAGTAAIEFDMRVIACETSGSESFIHGEVEGREWVLRQGGMLSVAVGQDLKISAAERDVVRF